jgi:hypothetical protein
MSNSQSLGAPAWIPSATIIPGACQECGAEQHQTIDPGDPHVRRSVIAHEPECTARVGPRRVIPW